jgi:hypothetical protein
VAQIQIMPPACPIKWAVARENGQVILHLRAAVQQLYAAGLGEFMATRAALAGEAKAAGEKDLAAQVGALRKPTVAAWALNQAVRELPDQFEEFHDFAELLREAQRTLDADQLRLLSRERARRVDALARKVEALARGAGQPVSDAVGEDIRATLTAFIASEDAEEAVRTGALVKALRYSGFGDVDIEGVAAVEAPRLRVLQGGAGADRDDAGKGDEPTEPDEAEQQRIRAELAARRAATRARLVNVLDRAVAARAEADHRAEVQAARLEEARAGVADLERQLATARERLAKATDALDELSAIRQEREAAEVAARTALETHDADEPT